MLYNILYSSGNLTVNGVSTLSGTVNANGIIASTITCSNWLRTTGDRGWYNETYKGGIYMSDSSYVRVYNNKSFVSPGCINSPSGFNVVQTGGTGVGISLYGSETTYVSAPTYGIMFAKISNYGQHGTVNADWATYFTMDITNGRGWLFRKSNNTFCASISTYGDIYASRNVVAYGEVTAYSTSDIRLKKNIKPITNPFSILKRSQPVLFEWNEKAFDLNKEKEVGIVPGLIAQWEQSVLPVAIHNMYEEYLGINYENYIPYLIAGINQHEDEIQKLKFKIKELEIKLQKYVA